MDFYKQKLTLDWQGIPLSVTYEPVWLGTDYSHIEVCSPKVPLAGDDWSGWTRQPLPISETGFRSIFVTAAILAEWDGPLPYVAAMLDAEAERPEWMAAQAKRQQLTLF